MSLVLKSPSKALVKLSELWKKGLSMVEIAAKLGTNTNALGVKLYRHRLRWPALFPRRHDYPEPVPTKRMLQISKLYCSGLDIPTVAKRLRLQPDALRNRIQKLRRVHPQLFPLRAPNSVEPGLRKRCPIESL